MKIVSVRLDQAEYVSLLRRAGPGRGALSRYIRRQLTEPAAMVRVSGTTTSAPAFVEWMTGHVGPNLHLRTL